MWPGLVTLGADPLLGPPEDDRRPLEEQLDLTPRAVHRWALRTGWTLEQAGNLAAWFAGIPVVDGEEMPRSAWTLRSIEHLLWLRWLVETGQTVPDLDGLASSGWRRRRSP